mmetsp:Transcript_17738/g.42864  ORF Transcript_17738/g.42864 Transcript_17738/m.42864 type:complete len:237 (+) Transcript_17738:216-926(+)
MHHRAMRVDDLDHVPGLRRRHGELPVHPEHQELRVVAEAGVLDLGGAEVEAQLGIVRASSRRLEHVFVVGEPRQHDRVDAPLSRSGEREVRASVLQHRRVVRQPVARVEDHSLRVHVLRRLYRPADVVGLAGRDPREDSVRNRGSAHELKRRRAFAGDRLLLSLQLRDDGVGSVHAGVHLRTRARLGSLDRGELGVELGGGVVRGCRVLAVLRRARARQHLDVPDDVRLLEGGAVA